MRFSQTTFATKSLFTIAVGTLTLAGCATADEDQQVDDLDAAPQFSHMSVCNGGTFSCKSHVRVDEHGRIKPFATPAGLGPADLVSAYKLNPAITSTATIAIIDAFHYANAAS